MKEKVDYMTEFFNKITTGLETSSLSEIDIGDLTPEQVVEIHRWAEMVLDKPEGIFNVDVLLVIIYLKRAAAFMMEAVELLRPYGEEGYRPKVKLVLEEVGKDPRIPPLHAQVFAAAAAQINEIDFLTRGIKSFLSIGILRRIVEADTENVSRPRRK